MSTTNILDLNNRIDELADSYPAAKVMLSDGVTSVEDRLDAHTVGTGVALTYDTDYTATSDGYAVGVISNASGNYVNVILEGITVSRGFASATYGGYANAFVKKGMKVKITGSSNIATGTFYPLS